MTPRTLRRMPRRIWSLLPAVLVFLAVALPAIFGHMARGRGYADQVNYHFRVVEKFARELPTPDVSDYVSATTPLYHIIHAILYKHVTSDVTTLQLLGSVYTLSLIGILWWFVSKSAPPLLAAVLILPIASSMYVLDAGIWILPDNLAYSMVALIMGLAFASVFKTRVIFICGITMALLVLTRQAHLWCAAVVWAGAWLARESRGLGEPSPALFSHIGPRMRPTFVAVALTLPAFAIVAWFWQHWGGRLTPPVFDSWYRVKGRSGLNLAAAPFLLSLMALYSVFFAGFLLPALTAMARRRPLLLALAVALGAALALVARTNYDLDSGRYGGIWNISRKLPTIADRSVFMVIMSIAGAVAVACWAYALDFRRRWLFLGCIVAYFAAQCANPWVYQKYSEPFFLILLALAASAIALPEIEPLDRSRPGAAALSVAARPRRKVIQFLRHAGPAALAGLLLAITLLSYRSAKPPVLLPLGAVEDPPTNAGAPK